MGQPLISIVLTSYNSERTIHNVLDSIVKQNFPLNDIELVLVDDGSRDNTLNIVNKFISENVHKFNNVKLIVHDRNYGVSKARNDGIKTSRGKYLLILDHDVIMPSNTLKMLLEYIESVSKKVVAVIPLHNNLCSGFLEKWEYKIRRRKITRSNSITSCALIKRELIDEIGLYDESLGLPFTIYEDIEYGARALAKGYEIHVVGTIEVLHDNCDETTTSLHAYSAVKSYKKFLNAMKSLSDPIYRYSLKKYLCSSPIWEKLRWIAYSALTASFIPIVVISTLLELKTFILAWMLFAIVMYLDVLRQHWNSSIPTVSFAYSTIAFTWRLARSTMLLIPGPRTTNRSRIK
jgi:glycosyltransferase involved in cell wall biosynthesis